jgi:hypothetical protein
MKADSLFFKHIAETENHAQATNNHAEIHNSVRKSVQGVDKIMETLRN